MPLHDLNIMKRGEAAQRMYDLGRTKGTTKEQESKPQEPICRDCGMDGRYCPCDFPWDKKGNPISKPIVGDGIPEDEVPYQPPKRKRGRPPKVKK